MWPNLQFSADLTTFTGEIFNEKLHFLCSVNYLIRSWMHLWFPFSEFNSYGTAWFSHRNDSSKNHLAYDVTLHMLANHGNFYVYRVKRVQSVRNKNQLFSQLLSFAELQISTFEKLRLTRNLLLLFL